MARFWLDAVRYGDTHGLHLDNYREMWPYRDWVVKAFNTNMPFDQFVIKQLAGDLLPDPTTDDLVATGFNRCHVTTNEGGSITEEVYVRNVVDRVTTTGTVFLGLSLECTRCHDHKYDPLTMRDFYSMFAFFNSLDGKAMDGNTARHEPIVKLPTTEQEQRTRELARQIDAAKEQVNVAIANVTWDQSLVGNSEQQNVGDVSDSDQRDSDQQPDEKSGKDGTQFFKTFSEWTQAKLADDQKGLPDPIKRAITTDAADRREDQRKQLRHYFIEYACASTRDTFQPLHEQLASLQKERDEIDKRITSTLVFRNSVNRVHRMSCIEENTTSNATKSNVRLPRFYHRCPTMLLEIGWALHNGSSTDNIRSRLASR